MLIYIVVIFKPDTESLSDVVDADMSEKSGTEKRFLGDIQRMHERYLENLQRLGTSDKTFTVEKGWGDIQRFGRSDNNLEFPAFHRMGRPANDEESDDDAMYAGCIECRLTYNKRVPDKDDRINYLVRFARPWPQNGPQTGYQNRFQERKKTIPSWLQKLFIGFRNYKLFQSRIINALD